MMPGPMVDETVMLRRYLPLAADGLAFTMLSSCDMTKPDTSGTSSPWIVAMNPPLGVVRELERVVSGGNSNWLSGQMMGVAQAVLLEEVAYAAVELYSGRLRFSTDLSDAAGAEVHFVAVGTPQTKGSHAADLTYVNAAVEGLLPHLADGDLVVGKSTVPVGTAKRLADVVRASSHPLT